MLVEGPEARVSLGKGIAPADKGRGDAAEVRDGSHNVWYNTRTPARVGLPAPVKTLLEGLEPV